jgi:hypothetical protein
MLSEAKSRLWRDENSVGARCNVPLHSYINIFLCPKISTKNLEI